MEVDKEENARKWEQAWNIEPGGLSRQRGLTTTEILSHAHPGGVRALYIMGENPMMTEPNLNVTRKHMEQLEFLVAQDIFINESGAFADVFLPAASWAEKEGTFTNTVACSACVAPLPRAASHVPIRRSSVIWRNVSSAAWAGRPVQAGTMPARKRSSARWPALPPC